MLDHRRSRSEDLSTRAQRGYRAKLGLPWRSRRTYPAPDEHIASPGACKHQRAPCLTCLRSGCEPSKAERTMCCRTPKTSQSKLWCTGRDKAPRTPLPCSVASTLLGNSSIGSMWSTKQASEEPSLPFEARPCYKRQRRALGRCS